MNVCEGLFGKSEIVGGVGVNILSKHIDGNGYIFWGLGLIFAYRLDEYFNRCDFSNIDWSSCANSNVPDYHYSVYQQGAVALMKYRASSLLQPATPLCGCNR